MALSYPTLGLADDVVLLRPWSEEDLGCVEEATHDGRIVEATSVPARYTPEAGRAFIARQRGRAERDEGLAFAVVAAGGGEARGMVWLGVRSQPGVMGVGYWLVPAARGRGLARRAVRLATDWTLRERGASRVESDNEASLRPLAAAGFRREGVLRSFLEPGSRRSDAVVFSRITGDLNDDPLPGSSRHGR